VRQFVGGDHKQDFHAVVRDDPKAVAEFVMLDRTCTRLFSTDADDDSAPPPCATTPESATPVVEVAFPQAIHRQTQLSAAPAHHAAQERIRVVSAVDDPHGSTSAGDAAADSSRS
jgi:hypothetical protein